MPTQLQDVIDTLSEADRGNISFLLEMKDTGSSHEIQDQIKWLYHDKARASAESTIRNVGNKLRTKISDSADEKVVERDDLREMPTYDALILGACKHLKATDEDASLGEHELFLSQAVILAALRQMKPRDRSKFFERQVDLPQILDGAKVGGINMKGPMATLATLGIAQASGFGVYQTSAVALGFLTHAVNVTLPFAVYTTLSSTIAFLIGPAGWLAAGVWGAWKITSRNWKKLIPALVYLCFVRSKPEVESLPKPV